MNVSFYSTSLVFDWSLLFLSLFNRKSIILVSTTVPRMGWTLSTASFEIHGQRNGPNGIIDITGDQSPAGHNGAMNGIMEQQIMQQAPPF